MPEACHVLKYGDLTASGIDGGLSGEKVDTAAATEARAATKGADEEKSMVVDN